MAYNIKTTGYDVTTNLKFHKNLLQAYSNISFIYNPNWRIEYFREQTLPVAFFAVLSCKETTSSEITQKPLLFNQPFNVNMISNNGVSNAVLGIVSDNIVNKPKRYELEIIYPLRDLLVSQNQYQWYPEMVWGVLSRQYVGKEEAKLRGDLTYGFVVAKTIITECLRSAINLVTISGNATGASTKTIISNIMNSVFSSNGVSYNENSLNAIWQSRCIVKMKLPQNFNYKTGSIVSLSQWRDASEEGWGRATLTLSEVPILQMINRTQAAIETTKNAFVSGMNTAANALGLGIVTGLNALEG